MKKLNLTNLNDEKSKLQEHEMDKIRAGLKGDRTGRYWHHFQARAACGCSGMLSFFMSYVNFVNDRI